jgi:hypothetical protein
MSFKASFTVWYGEPPVAHPFKDVEVETASGPFRFARPDGVTVWTVSGLTVEAERAA